MSVKRVLVTGGAGFLGSHLCDALRARGDEVASVDNYATCSNANIAHLADDPRFTALRHDVTAPLSVAADEIYNLACPASPVHYQDDPVQTLKTSVLGAANVLDLAKKRGAQVLQASTSEVYGDPKVHPQSEAYWGNVNPIGPRACYDEGKRAAETLFMDYHRRYGLKVRIARIFNTYGPRMRPNDGRVVSNFILQALKGEPITIYGDGAQTRSFCYCSDLVDGLLRLMDHPDPAFAAPVNLGNPEEIAIRDLADLVIDLAGSASALAFRPLPQDDPARRRPNIDRAKAALDWAPRVPLREGLAQTIAYFDGLLRKGASL